MIVILSSLSPSPGNWVLSKVMLFSIAPIMMESLDVGYVEFLVALL